MIMGKDKNYLFFNSIRKQECFSLYQKREKTTGMSFQLLERDLRKAMKSAGSSNRYQYIVISILCVIFYLNIFLIAGPSLYFMDPFFHCEDSDKVYDEEYACQRLQQCTIVNDYTIVAKMELYCHRQSERSIIQSSLSIGALFGLIVMNIVSDLKGRKKALLINLCIAMISSLITFLGATIQFTPFLVLGSVTSGFSGESLIIISYIILGDICSQSLRQKSSVYINSCLSLGLCSFYILYNWCNQWYDIVILFIFVPFSAVAILCYFVMEQSPNYFLFSEKNTEACIKTLIKIAKINNKTYSDVERIKYIINKIKGKMQMRKNQYGQDAQTHIFRSLTKWKYLKIIICMAIVLGGGNMSFYVIEYSINDIGYNFGFMNLVIGLTQISTILVVGSLVTTLQRKKTLAIFFGITPFLSMFFMVDFISASPFLSTLLILLMRVMTTTGSMMIVMIQTESFPLEIQSIGAGSIEALSQLGSFAAPLLNAFSINHSLPRVSTMGFVMLLCLIPLVFVPQSSSIKTKNQPNYIIERRIVQSQAYPV